MAGAEANPLVSDHRTMPLEAGIVYGGIVTFATLLATLGLGAFSFGEFSEGEYINGGVGIFATVAAFAIGLHWAMHARYNGKGWGYE